MVTESGTPPAWLTCIFSIKSGGSDGITYDQVRLSFDAAIDGQGIGELDVFENRVRPGIIAAIQPMSALFTNSPAINAVTQKWRSILDNYGVGHVYYVSGSGSDLVVVHVPPPTSGITKPHQAGAPMKTFPNMNTAPVKK